MKAIKKYAIILAAGKGTRMHSNKPKALVEILGKPMLNYLIESIDKSVIDEIILVVGNNKELFYELYDKRVTFAIQEEINGTATALKKAIPYLDFHGVAIVIPGDTPLIETKMIDEIIETHIASKKEVTLVTTEVMNPVGYGRIIRDRHGIKEIVEEKNSNKLTKKILEVNTGIMAFTLMNLEGYLNSIELNEVSNEYYLTDILKFIPRNEVNDIRTNDETLLGANDFVHLAKLEVLCNRRIIEAHMKDGVRFINPETSIVEDSVKLSKGVTIYPNTYLYGNTMIGPNSAVGPNTTITNSTISNDTTVKYSVISNSIIGAFNSIGPFSNIRDNCIIGNNNRIGNFVELKNSKIKDFTKASHHSYIGDTICGSNVNFGCGCITANYNGKIKQQTIIEDKAFIGCNSNLVAPIKIGESSYIAAGSTVTADVYPNSLVIARAKEIVKDYHKIE